MRQLITGGMLLSILVHSPCFNLLGLTGAYGAPGVSAK